MRISISQHQADNFVPNSITFEQLKEFVVAKDFNYCTHLFKDNHRIGTNVIEGFDFIILDVDNTATVKQAVEYFKNITYLLYTTKSHQIISKKNPNGNDRFRVILPLPTTLFLNREAYSHFMNVFIATLPFTVDIGACTDIVRYWYTNSKGILYTNEGGYINTVEMLKTQPITKPMKKHVFDSNYDEIWNALSHIDANCDRKDWLDIGMAIHHADSILGENRGYLFFDEWSKRSAEKYNQTDTKKTYDSITFDEKGITTETLFMVARNNGWQKDVSAMFSSINTVGKLVNPEHIMQALRPAPPDLNLQLLPPIVQAMSNELSSDVGADPLATALACLAVASGAIDSRIILEISYRFKVKPILWLMTIGEPSSKKTPASAPIFDILDKIQDEDHQNYKAKKLLWEGEEAKYNKQKADFLKYAANPLNSILENDNSNQPPTDLKPSPNPLRITVQDITSQKIIPICVNNPRGVLCYLDEMAGWCAKIHNIRGTENRSTWTVGYDGKRYEMDRVGTGSTLAKNLAISMYGNIQPHVLKKYIQDLSEDGMLQRFIPAVLRDSFDKVGTPITEAKSINPYWEQAVRKLFALGKHTYTLSPEAYDEFRKFQYWNEDLKKHLRKHNEEGRIFMTAVGKVEGTVGKLALVFHLMETEGMTSISLDVMQRVVAFVKTYVIPSYRYTYSEIGGVKGFDFTIWITNYVIKKSEKIIDLTLSGLKRAATQQFGQMQITDNFKKDVIIRDEMILLESYYWVVPVGDKNTKWRITKELTEHFHTYRKEVISDRENLLKIFASHKV